MSDYKFSRVIDYVEYGFPLTLDYENFNYNIDIVNHKSALEYPIAVEEYLNTEIGHKALVGPYTEPPFTKLHVSPMMTRCKPDGSRRLIVDLSWLPGESVNSCIPDNMLDGDMGILKYPTIDHIVDAITDVGKDALLFKVDLKRAYRNLRTDPRDLSVLGLQWGNQRYVDLSVPFGLKSGASSCELVTSGISDLFATSGIWTCSYLDDICGVAPPRTANSTFLSLVNLIESLGLPINQEKVSKPVQQLTCLGIDINAHTGVLSIPPEKISQIKTLCLQWATRK